MGRAIPWEQALIASCCIHKQDGRSFEAGFALALRANPPRSNIEKEIVGSVKQYCDDAWHGRKPALRSFSLEMLREGDRSGRARSAGTWTVQTMAESVAA